MEALFSIFEIPPPPPRDHTKRRKIREEGESRARKKERHEMEVARRASLADEEALRIKVVESVVRAYSSRDVAIAGGTADSVFANEEPTKGVYTTEVVGSGESDPPFC